jgi:MFS family permease
LSRRYGKRPVFLAATLFSVVGTAVGEAAHTYNYLLASRIIQGFATSPYESLIIAAVGDMFFVHQRGLRVAFITFILNAASSLASIIAGQITDNLGWQWLFHMLQIFTLVQFILMFLFCPETTFLRDSKYDIDQVQDEKLEQLAKDEHRHEVQVEVSNGDTSSNGAVIPKKKTFYQRLAVYTGIYSHENVLKLIFGPFITLLNVGACWSTIANGLLTAWYVTSAIMQAGIFAGPPWLFDAAQVGYLSTGPFVGGMVGSIIIATTSDPAAKWLTRLNKGI